MPLKPPSLPTFKLDLLVDKVAGGVHGELMPTLRYLKAWSPDTKIVLGMRDIEDSPQTMHEEWKKNKTHHLLDRVSPSLPLLVSLFPSLPHLGPGRSERLPPLSPLRTVRTIFTIHGSNQN